MSTLFHFSDRPDIEAFVPRPPLRHPNSEPLVYAIDAWHSPLYFFPRDCARICVWPVHDTLPDERQAFEQWTSKRMLLFYGVRYEPERRLKGLYRYELDPADGFEDTGDIGVWVSRQTVVPRAVAHLTDLAAESESAGVEVRMVDSLAETAKQFFDFEAMRFKTSLHVSMIRTSALPDWPLPPPTKPDWTSPN